MHKLPFNRLLALLLLALPLLAAAHGISESDRQHMLEGAYLRYISLGASHMLTGYDHLLFLFGVVFFLTTFKDVAKLVTVFHHWPLPHAGFCDVLQNHLELLPGGRHDRAQCHLQRL